MRSARSSFASQPLESLESRQLFSAFVSVVAVPSVVLPNRTGQAMIRVSNTGIGAVPTRVELFASRTRDLATDATLLGESKPIAAGQKSVQVRFSSVGIAAGTAYLVAQMVPAARSAERVLAVSAAARPTRFARATVDLTPMIVSLPPSQLYVAKDRATVTSAVIRVSNSGTVSALGKITTSVYASPSTTLDSTAIVVGSISLPHARIAAGQSQIIRVPMTFKAGTAFGGYTLFAKVEATPSIAETSVANNLVRSASAIVISQAAPVSGHHHHYHHGGGGVGVIVVIGDDDSGDDYDGGGSNPGTIGDDPGYYGGGGDSGAAPPSEPSAPTTQPDPPTTQPDDGGSNDGGSSDGGDFSGGGDASSAGDFSDSELFANNIRSHDVRNTPVRSTLPKLRVLRS